jgi:hypothetical protein
MKIGDIFYFVDLSTCKVSKHKVIELVPPCTQGQSEYVKFSYPLYYRTHPSYVHINPTPEEYPFKNTKFYGTVKCYLVFTEVEDAQRALVDYVLPKKIETEMEFCDLKREEFNMAVNRMNEAENKLKEQKEKFDKKCNALKKKFV